MSYTGTTTSGQLGTGGDNQVGADSGSATNLEPGKNLTVTGGEGIDTTIASSSGNLTVTVTAEEATDANKGVASFASADFSVSSGAVSLVDLTVSHLAAATLVTEGEGIGSNDNDTTLPTSAAVKDYVDAAVTAEDLDVTTDSGTIAIDLDSETLTVSGGEGIDTSATGNAITIAAEEATDSNKGVASFASADFSVSSGAVSLVDLTTSHLAAATLVTESEGIGSNDNDTTLPTSAAVKDYVDTKVTGEDLDVTTDSGTIDIDLDSETLTFSGGEGIDTSATGTTVTIAAEEATDSNKGVASFAAADFSVSSGAVSLVDLTTSHIAAGTLVIESEGIGSNDNDTTIPTSAAVKDYVDNNAGSGTITALNNQTANRLVTIGATTTELDGEANLTFDGSTLTCTADIAVTSSTSDKPELTLKNTNADANPATLHFTKDSGSPADDDELGEIVFNGDDDGGNATMFGKIVGVSADVTHGTEDGSIVFKIRSGGGVKQICSVDATALRVGEGEEEDTMVVFDGHAADFRIGLDDGTDKLEIGAGSAHGTTAALIIDSSGDVTKIGTDTPSDAQVLTWDNSNSKVVWSDAAGGGDTTELHVQTDSSSSSGSAASVDADAGVVMCVTASGARYVQLPAVATDRRIFIKDKSGNAATNNITIKTNSSEEIDGSSADLVLSTNWASVQIVSDGTKWYII